MLPRKRERRDEQKPRPKRSIVGKWLKSSSARGSSWPRKLWQRTRTDSQAGSTTDARIDPEAVLVTKQQGGERSRDAVLPEAVCGARSTRRSDVNRFPDLGAATTMHGLTEAGGGRARDPKKRSSDARKLTAMGYLRSTNPTKHPVSWSRLWLKLFLIRIMMRMVYQRSSQLQFQNKLDSAAFRDHRTLQIRRWSCRFRRFRRVQRTANQSTKPSSQPWRLWQSLWQRLR